MKSYRIRMGATLTLSVTALAFILLAIFGGGDNRTDLTMLLAAVACLVVQFLVIPAGLPRQGPDQPKRDVS